MAKYLPGPLATVISGSVSGTTFSRNRGGAYMRSRVIPSNPNTAYQVNIRADLATLAADWQTLTQAQRDAWAEWARQNPRTNSIGQSTTLSGEQAYISLNARILHDDGAVQVTPPIIAAPDAFNTISHTYDIGAGTVALTFAPALPAGHKAQLKACVVNSAGRAYVRNLLKLVANSPADQASPWNDEAAIVARLGTLVVGQRLHIRAAVYNPANGLLSLPLATSGAIVTT